MRKSTFLYMVPVLSVLLIAAAAPGTTILSDSYDMTQDSSAYTDCGLNAELATRQAGTVATVTYTRNFTDAWQSQVNHASHPGALWVLPMSSEPAGSVALAKNFAPNVQLDVAIDPVAGDTASSSWASVTIRGATQIPSSAYNVLAPESGAGIQIESGGGWTYFENGASTIGGSVSAVDVYNLSIAIDGDQISISINSAALDLNGAAAGTARTITGDVATRTDNYVTLGGLYDGIDGVTGHTFDDLVISDIPEPATISLLLLGGGAVLMRRRRKA